MNKQNKKGEPQQSDYDLDNKYLKMDICKFYEVCVKSLSEDDFVKAVFCDEVQDIIFDFMKV